MGLCYYPGEWDMAKASLDFYYDFASTYSYLAALRMGPLSEAAGVDVHWRPILLGPIFAARGLTTSPFAADPEKGRHMWRDMERLAARHGLPAVVKPPVMPANSLLAARVAVCLNEASRPAFSREIFHRAFARGQDIGEPEVVRQALAGLGHFSEDVMETAQAQANKDRLRAQTDAARAAGVFGAPTFICADGELFWGHDRLEMALEHAAMSARR